MAVSAMRGQLSGFDIEKRRGKRGMRCDKTLEVRALMMSVFVLYREVERIRRSGVFGMLDLTRSHR